MVMNRDPPPYRGHTTGERILDHLTDIYLSAKAIFQELEEWNKRPVRGRIFIDGVESVTTSTTTDIPNDDVPAVVDWQDRFGGSIHHEATDTIWSAEDANGSPSTAVRINPSLDADRDDETATVVFQQATGQFRVVAITQGSSGQIRAESQLYNIVPGAPAVGTITVNPVS